MGAWVGGAIRAGSGAGVVRLHSVDHILNDAESQEEVRLMIFSL